MAPGTRAKATIPPPPQARRRRYMRRASSCRFRASGCLGLHMFAAPNPPSRGEVWNGMRVLVAAHDMPLSTCDFRRSYGQRRLATPMAVSVILLSFQSRLPGDRRIPPAGGLPGRCSRATAAPSHDPPQLGGVVTAIGATVDVLIDSIEPVVVGRDDQHAAAAEVDVRCGHSLARSATLRNAVVAPANCANTGSISATRYRASGSA